MVAKRGCAGRSELLAALVGLALSSTTEVGHAQSAGVVTSGVLATTAAEQPTVATGISGTPALSAGAQAASTAATAPLQEVVVTATRREEPEMRVPIDISAVTERQIDAEGLRTLEDIARLTPDVQFDPSTGKVTIRGIEGNELGQGPVGIYIDDTPIQVRTFGTDTENAIQRLFDLDRVEILRGPQGTLFGAGSEGGTVRYILGQPSLDTWSVYGRAEINDMQYGTMGGEAGIAVGGPLIQDEVGFRFDAWDQRTPGYVDRIMAVPPYATLDSNANWTNTSLLRLALTAKPIENLTITPTLLYQASYTPNHTSSFVVALSNPDQGVFRSESPSSQYNWDQFFLPALRLDYNLGFAHLIYDGSFFDRGQYGNNDYTTFMASLFGLLTPTGPNYAGLPSYATHTDADNTQRNLTQELRLQSANPEALISWTAGAFYSHDSQNNREHQHDPDYYLFFTDILGFPNFGPLLPPDYSYYGTDDSVDVQEAIYAQLDFHITHQLTLTVGERLSRFLLSYYVLQNGPYATGGTTPTINSGHATQNAVTPLYNVTYQANAQNMFYATVSKGFRPGGVSDPYPAGLCGPSLAALGLTGAPPTTFQPDDVWNYEVGAKNVLAGGRVRISTSVYEMDWYHIQTALPLPSCGYTLDTNVGAARSEGFDLQADFVVLPSLTLGLTVGRTNAFYSQTVYGAGSGGPPPILTQNGNSIGGPPWTVGGTWDWRFRLLGRASYLTGYYSYLEKNKGLTPEQDPATASYIPQSVYPVPPTSHYATVRLGMVFQDLDVSLFVNNLTNERTFLTYGAPAGTPFFSATVYPPRTFGVTVIYRR